MKTHRVKGNRTAADAAKNNDVVLKSGLSLDEARLLAIRLQKSGEFVAAWVEEEGPKGSSVAIVPVAPRIQDAETKIIRTTARQLPRVTMRMPSMAEMWFSAMVA
jgi:hypothetical protein